MHRFAKLSALVVAVMSLYAVPALAQVDAQCNGTVNQTWTPGLQLFPRDISYTNTSVYDQCSTSVPGVYAARIDVAATFNNSCLANLGPAEATLVWSDGEISTFTFQGVGINVVGNVQAFLSLGEVTSGRFAGDQVVLLNTLVTTSLLACLTPRGLTSLAGSSSLTFIRLL